MSRRDILDYNAGSSLAIDVTCKDENGDAIDLTGATEISWSIGRIGRRVTSLDRLLTKTSDSEDEIEVVDASAGQITIYVADGDFLRAGEFTHELKVVLITGERLVPMQGRFRSHGSLYAEDTSCPDGYDYYNRCCDW
jgi:hypothetical protein